VNSNSAINVAEDDFDDNMILDIVAELDDTLAEEEKLAKAKEKLANILIKMKEERLKVWQGSTPGKQGMNVRKMHLLRMTSEWLLQIKQCSEGKAKVLCWNASPVQTNLLQPRLGKTWSSSN